jgi:hypothetical protein
MPKHGWVEQYNVDTVMEGFAKCPFLLAVHHGVSTAIYMPPHVILGKGFGRISGFARNLLTEPSS